MTTRRDFLGGAVAFAAAGCASTGGRPFARHVATGEIKAFLLHLGHNMWCDYLPDDMDNEKILGRDKPDTVLRNKTPLWNRAVARMAERKLTMLVVDLGEGLVYPSHPELAIEGSWTPEQMRDEITRLAGMGIEVIPKLNFSATHNGWMKQWHNRLSTREYYGFCEDVIRDVAEIFGTPRFMHIGYDEEYAAHQEKFHGHRFVAARLKELWAHDFLHIVRTCEKNGMRAWAWNDYGWDHPEFYDFCPKSVLMCSWFYDEAYGGFDVNTNKTKDLPTLKAFYELDRRGFEQVACGSNWSGWRRRQLKCGADDVIGKLVKMCRKDLSTKSLKGFMMAPWASCDTEENLQKNLKGIDLLADALGG